MKFLWQKNLLVFTLIFTIALLAFNFYESKETLSSKDLIRLQVIGNSDSFEDQELKRKIRDRIISEMGDAFKENTDVLTARKAINQELSNIEKIAQEEIALAGKEYDATVKLGSFPFPTKTYGNFVLPAGKYEALRVILGDGQGANWWCVLFPPLCFIDITTSVAEDVKVETTEKEIEKEDVVVKFKIIELIKNIF